MNNSIQTRKRNGAIGSFPTLFNQFFNDPFFGGSLAELPTSVFAGKYGYMPSANIRETDDRFIVELSAPGLKRADFRVDLEDGMLTISSEKEEEKKEEDSSYRRREFSFSSFTRSFALPENVDESQINARYQDGILEVTIPKKEVSAKKPKKQIRIT
jgi:HSP20 family protein